MEGMHVQLDEIDRAILYSYRDLVENLSGYLGDGYEIVLHSLEDYNHSVIKIVNGYHTGRTEGAPITDLALEMLAQIESGAERRSPAPYFSKNAKGEPMKSVTIAIRGRRDNVIGLLCINFYLNTPFSQVLQGFFGASGGPMTHLNEHFTDNVDDLIESSVSKARSEVYANPLISSSNKNKEIISILSKRGIFNLKDGVVKTAAILGISKNTVYMHLRNLGEE